MNMDPHDAMHETPAPTMSPTVSVPIPEGMEDRNYADIKIALQLLDNLVERYVAEGKLSENDKTFVLGSFVDFYKEASSDASVSVPARFINSYLTNRGFHFSERRKEPREERKAEETKKIGNGLDTSASVSFSKSKVLRPGIDQRLASTGPESRILGPDGSYIEE